MDLFTLVVLMIVVGILALRISRVKRFISRLNMIPGPKSYHVLGNLSEAIQPLDHLLQRIERLFLVYQDTFVYWLGPLPMVFVRAPEHLEVGFNVNIQHNLISC
ncbi:Cytochrome P450 4C1 [Blattella germanica]|nr:Cytochrome P450 4C1 [Blattella germanica]